MILQFGDYAPLGHIPEDPWPTSICIYAYANISEWRREDSKASGTKRIATKPPKIATGGAAVSHDEHIKAKTSVGSGVGKEWRMNFNCNITIHIYYAWRHSTESVKYDTLVPDRYLRSSESECWTG